MNFALVDLIRDANFVINALDCLLLFEFALVFEVLGKSNNVHGNLLSIKELGYNSFCYF